MTMTPFTLALLGTCGGLTICPALLPPLSGVHREPWPLERAGLVVAPPPACRDEPVLALLDALEASAADLRAFTGTLRYETEDALLGQKVIRTGEILYCRDAEHGQRFAIRFDHVIENRRKVARRKGYIFGGGWLVEVDYQRREFVKRQIARPGAGLDPLKLGQGPIPLPIGQSRAEVLRRFEASLIDLPAAGPLAHLPAAEVDGIRLVPRAGTRQAKDVDHVDLFYDRRTRLPVGINLIEPNGNRKTVRLGALARNPVLDETALARLDLEAPKEGWRIDIRALDPPR